MQKKIILIPLDERPCNYVFPQELLKNNDEYRLCVPPRSVLGNKKTPANLRALDEFLYTESKSADIAIISVDMLLYGGLIAGRLHEKSRSELNERLTLLKTLKEKNPKLKIYAFSLIMRCPRYSSSDEEPDYYAECGKEIFLLGEAEHKKKLGKPFDEENYEKLKTKCAPYINDYLTRRAVNVEMNLAVVDLVGSVIDYLIIPQDDSAVYGFMAMDQQRVREYVEENRKQNLVSIYPGADEVAMTLLARAVQSDKGKMLTVNCFYSSEHGKFVVPLYEDRMLCESVKCQVRAAGLKEDCCDYDFSLAINAPSSDMTEASEQGSNCVNYTVNRSLSEFANRIYTEIQRGRSVAVADVAYGNGGDISLVKMLDDYNIAGKISAYAGWNTSGNTLGTTIATAVFSKLFGKESTADFIALRFFEDVGFCSSARWSVSEELESFGVGYYDLKDKNDKISERVAEKTQSAMRSFMPNFTNGYEITYCRMPWNRMFEVYFEVKRKD